MSQTPHPHDPFGNEPSTGVPEQPLTSAQSSEDMASPTSDPALHPHDPYAASAQPAGASADPAASGNSAASAGPAPYASGSSAAEPSVGSPYGAPAAASAGATGQPFGEAPTNGYAHPSGYAQQDGYAQQGAYQQPGDQGQQGGYGQQQAPHAGPQSTDVPPPGTKGVYDGPLSGQPLAESDNRMWAMFSQLTVTLGHVVSWGFLGWVGPLIIFLVYKDRSRFVRFHAAEALNGAITVLIAQVVLSIVLGIFAIVTLGIGSPLLALVPIPALVQFIFSILGAVKANQGQWWSYPLNLRLVK